MIFIIVGLVITFSLLMIFSNRKTRNCRWREDRTKDVDGARYFHCTACGGETFIKDGNSPKICLAAAPDKPL